jgi:predicted transcriptional regulator
MPKEEVTMATAKKAVSDLLKKLPDNCSLEDVQYHLYVLQKVGRGLKDVAEGRVYTQEEVEKTMAKWLDE